MPEKPRLQRLAETLSGLGLMRTPPAVLLTRWQLLQGDEDLAFFDAVMESGSDVPGARYTFVGVSASAVSFLQAEHDDEMWAQTRFSSQGAGGITPRTLDAWRRPLTAVIELRLAGTPWDWLPDEALDRPQSPSIVLRMGDRELTLPLPKKTRAVAPPDVAPVVRLLQDGWADHAHAPAYKPVVDD